MKLRADRYAQMFAAIGCTKESDIAAAAGYTTRTIRRARNGQLGAVFIANTIHTLSRHKDKLAEHGLTPALDELFEVVEQSAA